MLSSAAQVPALTPCSRLSFAEPLSLLHDSNGGCPAEESLNPRPHSHCLSLSPVSGKSQGHMTVCPRAAALLLRRWEGCTGAHGRAGEGSPYNSVQKCKDSVLLHFYRAFWSVIISLSPLKAVVR